MKLNKQQIGVILIGVVLLAGYVLFLYAQKGGDAETQTLQIAEDSQAGSVYQTKLEAIKAEEKESVQTSQISANWSAYNDKAEPQEMLHSSDNGTQATPSQKNNTAKYDAEMEESIKKTKAIVRQVHAEGYGISDEEYQEISQEVQQRYQSRSPRPISENDKEDPRERRKRELEESWNKVTIREDNNIQMNVSGYKAVIHGNQTVSNGHTVLIRTTQTMVTPTGTQIPAQTLIAGIVSVAKNRLNININSVRIDNTILPVSLAVYGTDGITGIPIDVDVTKQVSGDEIKQEALQQISSNSRRYGGAIGGAVGDVVVATSRALKRTKDQSIKLLDNQQVILKFM